MKKIILAIALGAMTMAACNKQPIENVSDPVSHVAVIRATGENYNDVDENGITKATLDGENVVWVDGDQLGVRLYKGDAVTGTDPGSSYGAWDASFTIDEGEAGKTNANFSCPTDVDEWLKAYAAWYPRYTDSDQTNVGGDAKIYFYLRSWYDGYTSGSNLMPMLADMSSWSASNTAVSLKQVGAGLRVTLKDVPASAYQASLTVNGQNIAGWYAIDSPSDAGTASLAATSGTDNNTVYLKFGTASEKRDVTLIFPLPTVDLSGGVTIKLYYGDGIEFWSRKASGLPALGRGELLDMPELTVNKDPDGKVTLWFIPKKTVTNSASFNCWAYSGDWPGHNMINDFVEIDHNKYYKIELDASWVWGQTREFRFVDVDKWASNMTSVTFSKCKMEYFFEAYENQDLVEVSKLPDPVEITIDGSFDDWSALVGTEVTATNYKTTMKGFSDGTSLYIYIRLDQLVDGKYDLASADWMRLYFDKDNDSSTGVSDWYRPGADDVDDANNDFRLKIQTPGYGFRGILQSTGSTYNPEVSIVENTTDHYSEMEIKFDIAALGHVTPTTPLADRINIFCLGYGPTEFTGKVTGVIL